MKDTFTKEKNMANGNIKPVENTYSAEEVAACLLWVADKDEPAVVVPNSVHPVKDGVTNLKLQKLLFFAQATHLALFKKPLFNEDFQAWPLGPVLPGVYEKYKENISNPIPVSSSAHCKDEELINFLDAVWKTFGKYTASELVNLSHTQGAPWKNHFKEGSIEVIPKDEIGEYYSKIFVKSDEQRERV